MGASVGEGAPEGLDAPTVSGPAPRAASGAGAGTGTGSVPAVPGLLPHLFRRQGPRLRGRPTSANGASSFHLWWVLDAGEPVTEVAATLEVLEPPSVSRLYFWALQASFGDADGPRGGGHLGLQWWAARPPGRYVNWGGYRGGAEGGGELDGTPSALPSALASPNTRDYPWRAGRPYRLRIHPSPDGAGLWRGEVTDLVDLAPVVVRDLHCPADRLVDPVVWSEVFARCDDPPVSVRWSDLEAVTVSGRAVAAGAVTVGYQRRQDGGCDNTSVAVDGRGWLQRTTTRRRVAAGTRLPLRSARA